jgi:hypothetical protein
MAPMKLVKLLKVAIHELSLRCQRVKIQSLPLGCYTGRVTQLHHRVHTHGRS